MDERLSPWLIFWSLIPTHYLFSGITNQVAEENGSTFPHKWLPCATSCNKCNGVVSQPRGGRETHTCMMYTHDHGVQRVTMGKVHCETCNITIFGPHVFTSNRRQGGGSVIHNSEWPTDPSDVFVSTSQTFFDVKLLMSLDMDLLHNRSTFHGFTRSYNDKWRKFYSMQKRDSWVEQLDSNLPSVRWLHDERLFEAWLRWTLVNFLR